MGLPEDVVKAQAILEMLKGSNPDYVKKLVKDEVTSQLDNIDFSEFVTNQVMEQYVSSEIAKIPQPDMSDYYTKSQVDTLFNDFTPDLTNYISKTDWNKFYNTIHSRTFSYNNGDLSLINTESKFLTTVDTQITFSQYGDLMSVSFWGREKTQSTYTNSTYSRVFPKSRGYETFYGILPDTSGIYPVYLIVHNNLFNIETRGNSLPSDTMVTSYKFTYMLVNDFNWDEWIESLEVA